LSAGPTDPPGDVNSDNVVNIFDLSIMLSNWGRTGMTPAQGDLNSDNAVNIFDLSILLSNWGKTGGGASGQPMPVGNVTSGGHTWTPIFSEDFTKDAPLGSWDDSGTLTTCPADRGGVRYTGTTGTKWASYPKCFKDTYQKRPYRADAVLSVAGGVLDFWLHTVDGRPAGANPSPIIHADGTSHQTYGRYVVRMRQTTTNLSDYYHAFLLWPTSDAYYQCAESDFPEGSLGSSTAAAFHHYGTFSGGVCTPSPSVQDYFARTIDKTQWHTFTQEWMPGRRNYYIDGQLIGSSTNNVWSLPQKWQLQTETKSTCESTNTCTQNGHVMIDWAVVYAY
jgi:hypothetical protein